VAVTVAATVSVTVSVEQNQAENVDDKAGDADVQHPVRMLDLVHVSQSLDRLDKDREAQRNEEHRVDESAENFGARPPVRVLVRVQLRYLRNETIQHLKRQSKTRVIPVPFGSQGSTDL